IAAGDASSKYDVLYDTINSINKNLTKECYCTKELVMRVVITVVVFFVLYFFLPLLLQYKGYDVYVQAICILAAVVGAGLYWVGSNKKLNRE
ncbi:MAG: hypothetical protein IJC91_04175, partial [Oscillospiraceae bacterium]|nr:hypothetical protein [Oscillospiraceae bacterium]